MMSQYVFGIRPKGKKDQTLMDKAEIRSVSKGRPAGSIRIAEAFLKRNPSLGKIFNRQSERKELAKYLYDLGGGKSASKMHDRFGFSEDDMVKTLKEMYAGKKLGRSDMIQAAKKSLKSGGAYRRRILNEIYDARPDSVRDSSETGSKENPVSTTDHRRPSVVAKPSPDASPVPFRKSHEKPKGRDGADPSAVRKEEPSSPASRKISYAKGPATGRSAALELLEKRREEKKRYEKRERRLTGEKTSVETLSQGLVSQETRERMGRKDEEERASKIRSVDRHENLERWHEDNGRRVVSEKTGGTSVTKLPTGPDATVMTPSAPQARPRDSSGHGFGSIYTDVFSFKNDRVRDFGTYKSSSKDTFAGRNRGGVNSSTGPSASGHADARRFLPATPRRNLSTGLVPPRKTFGAVEPSRESFPNQRPGIPSSYMHGPAS